MAVADFNLIEEAIRFTEDKHRRISVEDTFINLMVGNNDVVSGEVRNNLKDFTSLDYARALVKAGATKSLLCNQLHQVMNLNAPGACVIGPKSDIEKAIQLENDVNQMGLNIENFKAYLSRFPGTPARDVPGFFDNFCQKDEANVLAQSVKDYENVFRGTLNVGSHTSYENMQTVDVSGILNNDGFQAEVAANTVPLYNVGTQMSPNSGFTK